MCRSHSFDGDIQKEREDDVNDVNDFVNDGSNNAVYGNERNRRRKRR